jgi:DNA-binding MarR family transcriptional regulator
MPEWTFITKHGLVLNYLAKYPKSRARDIAEAIGATEWTIIKVISELEKEGYIEKTKLGRRNTYQVKPELKLRHQTVRDVMVGDLLIILGGNSNK